MIVGCPTCGAEVEFRYDDSFVRVCGHCRSAVVRTDRGVDTLGRFADLIPIQSALRLFAEGRYGSSGFLLIGMAQLRHAAGGIWQEWYAKLDPSRGDQFRSAAKQGSESPYGEGPPAGDGGQWAWITEAQGQLYLTFERADVPAPPIDALSPGAHVQLAGQTFTVAERSTATYASALGEIPYRLVPMSTFQFVDLSDGSGGFATIDYGDGSDAPAVYLGAQVTSQSLGLSGGEARAEAAKPATGARLACPNCNGSLELRAPDQTLRIACPYCGTLVSVEDGALSIIARQAQKPQPTIPLGTVATFAEGELTVIGYVARSAYVDGSWWPFEEYLLHAPGLGFRWLVCSDGHWSYVQAVSGGAVSHSLHTSYGGVPFKRFQVSTLRVDSVLGEFYWRVEAGEQVSSEDFIAPPAMLSREASASEENWSLATYLTAREVERAVGRSVGLQARDTVAPNQPYPGGVGKVTALVAVAFFAVAIGKCASSTGADKLRQRFTVPAHSAAPKSALEAAAKDAFRSALLAGRPPLPTTHPAGSDAAPDEPPGAVMFSDKFQLDGGRNVAFDLSADVQNNWVSAALDLVNEDTGGVVSFDKTLEYYSGSDDGESWSEGSRSADEVIGPVEAGSYVLRVEAQHGGLDAVDLHVVVRQGVFTWTWFWIGFVVLAIPFGIVGAHAGSFRKRRWQNSNVGRAGALSIGDTHSSDDGEDDD